LNGHALQRIRACKVALVPHPCSDEPVLIEIGQEGEAVGCETCGALLEECKKKPCEGAQLAAVSDA
jgi:hypothetical protein